MSDYTYAPPPTPQPPEHGDCPDAGAPSFAFNASATLNLDLGNLSALSPPAENIPQIGDILHFDLAGSELEVAGPFPLFASDCPDGQPAEPLISISAGFDGGSTGGEAASGVGGAFLARLLEPATGAVTSASGLVADGFGPQTDDGGADHCQCDGLLQPLVGNVLDQVDNLLA